MASQVPLIETPTRASGCGTGGSNTAAKHDRDVLGKSSKEAPDRLRRHEKDRSSRSHVMNSRNFVDVDGQDKSSERILTSKDQNAMMGADGLGSDSGNSHALSAAASANLI